MPKYPQERKRFLKELSLHILDIAQNSIAAGAKTIRITYFEQGDILALTIEDDGQGMEPGFLARSSDPFTTTRKTRSVGLGLPFLRLSAELTGGSFGIESTPGKGTTVTANIILINRCPAVRDLAASLRIDQGGSRLEIIWTHRKDNRAIRWHRNTRADWGMSPLTAGGVRLDPRVYFGAGKCSYFIIQGGRAR
jgi:hypothetical protein